MDISLILEPRGSSSSSKQQQDTRTTYGQPSSSFVSENLPPPGSPSFAQKSCPDGHPGPPSEHVAAHHGPPTYPPSLAPITAYSHEPAAMGGLDQVVGAHTIQPPVKRPPSDETHPFEPLAKKQTKWSAVENELIIRLRGDGMKGDDVSRHLPGKSAISCRLHYQKFLERRPGWDEEKKNKLARLYERYVLCSFFLPSPRLGGPRSTIDQRSIARI